MTVPVSTVPSVKAYLLAQITAAVTPDAEHRVGVYYTGPSVDFPDDIVAVGEVTNRVVEYDAMVGSGGAGWLSERYEVEVVVDCFRPGNHPDVVDARAWALVSVVETVVRVDPSLGGRVVQARPSVVRSESSWDDKHKGHRVRVPVAIEVLASI